MAVFFLSYASSLARQGGGGLIHPRFLFVMIKSAELIKLFPKWFTNNICDLKILIPSSKPFVRNHKYIQVNNDNGFFIHDVKDEYCHPSLFPTKINVLEVTNEDL